ncbi:MAG: hypothetical protein JRI68_16755, partial [Deltaproteobacteria bacterium]|nr:hypothetical protein [Deltaproteobacteria bacterium]
DGQLCVYGEAPEVPGSHGPPQTFVGDQPIYVTVSTDSCISACIQDEVASCTVSRSGTTLTVTSELSYDEPPEGEGCIALCGSLTAECSSPPLPPASYSIVHGDAHHELGVPSADVPPCL